MAAATALSVTSNRDQRFCELERMIADLRQEKELLRRRCNRLASENKKLKKGAGTATAYVRRCAELERDLAAVRRSQRDCIRRLAVMVPHVLPVLGGWRGGRVAPDADFAALVLPGAVAAGSRTRDGEANAAVGSR